MNPQLAPTMRATALGYHRILAETIAAREADRTTDCDPTKRRRQFQSPAKPLPNFTAQADRPRRDPDEPDTRIGVAQAKESPDDLLRRYRRAVTRRSDHPMLVLVNGLPGAGKTYLAEKFVNELGFIRVSSDDIRMALTGGFPNYHSFPEVQLTFGTVRRIIEALLADGARVVADSTGRVYRERRETIAVGRSSGVPVVVVWCKVDDATAAQRMFKRATGRDEADRSEADASVRARMAQNATPPSANEADLVITWTPPIEEQVWGKLRSFVGASESERRRP
jgi:predicted kinase